LVFKEWGKQRRLRKDEVKKKSSRRKQLDNSICVKSLSILGRGEQISGFLSESKGMSDREKAPRGRKTWGREKKGERKEGNVRCKWWTLKDKGGGGARKNVFGKTNVGRALRSETFHFERRERQKKGNRMDGKKRGLVLGKKNAAGGRTGRGGREKGEQKRKKAQKKKNKTILLTEKSRKETSEATLFRQEKGGEFIKNRFRTNQNSRLWVRGRGRL